MPEWSKVPISFDLFIDEKEIIKKALTEASKTITSRIEEEINRAYISEAILESVNKQMSETDVTKILNSEEFIEKVAEEIAKDFRLRERFRWAIEQNIKTTEIVPFTPDEINDTTSIEFLPLSIRVSNALRRRGVKNVGDIKKLTLLDLLNVRNLGAKGTDELIRMMKTIGFTFDYSKEDAVEQEDGDAEVDKT